MGILPSKESHEYPGAFHFAQSGCHAMAILPLTEHFFPSVDSLAFKQLYACRDMQSAKYNFSLVSPQIIAKYRERALEQLRAKEAAGEAGMAPPKDRWEAKPYLAEGGGSGDATSAVKAGDEANHNGEGDVTDAEVARWIAVNGITAENYREFFKDDTRCISPDESQWPFPHGEEELCGELQHPNPSAHWRTHDAAKQYLQLENESLGITNAPYVTAGDGVDGQQCTPSSQTPPQSQQQQQQQSPHRRNVSLELGMTPEEAQEYADHERELIDKFFSRSPEALYNALVVEPNKGFLVDTNKEMCDIYAAEMRWKEARNIVRAYRRQCKKDEEAASSDPAAAAAAASETSQQEQQQQQPAQRRITKEEADEAAKVPPPPLFLRPAPQVIVVRIQREEEEATRAKYFADQQRRQRRGGGGGGGHNAHYDDDTASLGSRSARSHPTSAARSPVSESMHAMPHPKSPTVTSSSPLHSPSLRYHRFEGDDRYKDGRIHLVEEDGVLYMFAYNTAYVDPRKRAKERKQRREEAKKRSMDQLERRTTPSSSAAGDEDGLEEQEDINAGMLGKENRQTSSFYHTVDAFGIEEAESAPLGGSTGKKSPSASAKAAATHTIDAVSVVDGSRHPHNTTGADAEDDDYEDDDDDTALSAKRGGRERQQDTAVFIDGAESHNSPTAPHTSDDAVAAAPHRHARDGESDDDDDEEDDSYSDDSAYDNEAAELYDGDAGAEEDGTGQSAKHRLRRHRRRGHRHTGTSMISESTATDTTSPTERPREVQQLQLFTAAPFILPICPVRVVGCNGYTESSCRGTPWLRGYDDDPEEDAYVESLPVRPPVMSGGGFIDANIGDKILSRAFLLGFQVFRNVCLDAGLPETLTRPFWTLGLLSNIPMLQISREMRFRMRAAAAEVQLGFQGLRDMIKGTENDLQSYIYGFSDILPYLERASQARLQRAAEEEAAADNEDADEAHERSRSMTDVKTPQAEHPLLVPETSGPYVLPTRASQPVVQRSLRFPRSPIEFYTQFTIRGNQCLSRIRTESQLSFFHLIAEATAPVSTSLFMRPMELNMYDYGGAIRLHLLKNRHTSAPEMQVLPPPKNVEQLIRDHQRRVQLRKLARQSDDANSGTHPNASSTAAGGKPAPEEDAAATTGTKSGVRKSAKEREDNAMPPYLVYTIVQPSASAVGPSLEHYRRIMQPPPDAPSADVLVDFADAEMASLIDPEVTRPLNEQSRKTAMNAGPAEAGEAQTTADDVSNDHNNDVDTAKALTQLRCSCAASEQEDAEAAAAVFPPHQYMYELGSFVDGDMVIYNVHAGRWEHFEYFHRQQVAQRKAQRQKQKEQLQLAASSTAPDAEKNATTASTTTAGDEKQPEKKSAEETGVAKGGDSADPENKPAAELQAEPSVSATSVQAVDAHGNVVIEDLCDEDEEDIHQEDILLCWIKRRLQSATMRNRQDPGWLRDSEDHIVQEGRYYIWGFEHDDQRYFYGLIPKFAKEKKAKRHNNNNTSNSNITGSGMNTHMNLSAMNSHHRRHGAGGSSAGTPSAMSISPSMSNVSAHELRRLPVSGRQRNNNNNNSSSGRNHNTNSPGSRSARSSQSQSSRSPRNLPQRCDRLGSGGGGVGGTGMMPMMASNDPSADYSPAAAAAAAGSGCHVHADGDLVVSFPDSQTRRAQRSPGNNSNSPGNSNINVHQHHSSSHSGLRAHAEGNSVASGSPIQSAPSPAVPSSAAAGGSAGGAPVSATRPGKNGPTPQPKMMAFMAAAAAAVSHNDNDRDVELSITSSPADSPNRGAGPVYPPRVGSAPLHTSATAMTKSQQQQQQPTSASGGANNNNNNSTSSNTSAPAPGGAQEGGRMRGQRRPNQDGTVGGPQQQQQQPDYNNNSSSTRRGGGAGQTSNPVQQQQMSPPPATGPQQKQPPHPPYARTGPNANAHHRSSNANDYFAAQQMSSSNPQSPPPPPPPPLPAAGPSGGGYDPSRSHMSASPQQQQQPQQPQATPHLHPPTVYMNTNTVNTYGNAPPPPQPQQQQPQQQTQVPQPRRAQQQQQQQQQQQMNAQGYPPYNSQAPRGPQPPYNPQPNAMMSGVNMSPPPQQPQQPQLPMGDAPPPPMPQSMTTRRAAGNNNNNNNNNIMMPAHNAMGMMGGGNPGMPPGPQQHQQQSVPGMYMDGSNAPTPNMSRNTSYYPDAGMPVSMPQPQQQQQQQPMMMSPPMSQQQQQQHPQQQPQQRGGNAVGSFYSAPPQMMSGAGGNSQQQQQHIQTPQAAYSMEGDHNLHHHHSNNNAYVNAGNSGAMGGTDYVSGPGGYANTPMNVPRGGGGGPAGRMSGAESAPPSVPQQQNQQPNMNRNAMAAPQSYNAAGRMTGAMYGGDQTLPQQQQQQQQPMMMNAGNMRGNTTAVPLSTGPLPARTAGMNAGAGGNINAYPPAHTMAASTTTTHVNTNTSGAARTGAGVGDLSGMYNNNANAMGGWANNSNTSSSSGAVPPQQQQQQQSSSVGYNTVGGARGGPKGSYPMQNASNPSSSSSAYNAQSTMNPNAPGRTSAYPSSGNTPNPGGYRTQQPPQQQHQGGYATQPRDGSANAYGQEMYNTSFSGSNASTNNNNNNGGGGGNTNANVGGGFSNNSSNNRVSNSPFPQQYQQQQQVHGAPSHTSSYAPTPLPATPQQPYANTYNYNAEQPQQQQQQTQQQQQHSTYSTPAPPPTTAAPHPASTHNNPYNTSVTASPALSYASHPSMTRETSLPQQQQQQQQRQGGGGNGSQGSGAYGYGYGGSTSPHPQSDASQQQQQQRASQHAPQLSAPNRTIGAASASAAAQQLVTPTGSAANFNRAMGGAGQSGGYGPASGQAGAASARSQQQQQQQHSVPPSPAPNTAHFPSGPQQQQQQQSPTANASGTLLRSSPSPQLRPHPQQQQYPQQRYVPQPQQQQQAYNTHPSPNAQVLPQQYSQQQQQHLSPYPGMESQQQRSADSYSEGSGYDPNNSLGQPRFAHNPYAMQ